MPNNLKYRIHPSPIADDTAQKANTDSTDFADTGANADFADFTDQSFSRKKRDHL
jgi:hypothetical protein